MANNVRIHTEVNGNAGKELKSLRDGWDTFQKQGAKGLGIGVGIAAATKGFDLLDTAVSKGIEFIGDAITKGSDLRESMSLTQQVFEGNADAVGAWADDAAHAFGESATEARNFAASFGTAFKNVGQSIDETTKHAEEMTHLAADLGSAFKASSEEAATALRSGLLGESEPLRRFGVFLDEAKVKAQATAMGMKPLNGALSDGQKVAARYAIIMKQTADSQGMFGRDTGSLEDAQKKLSAEVDNLQAKLGTALLPTVLEVTKATAELVDEVTAAGGPLEVMGQGVSDLERDLNSIDKAVVGAGIGIHEFVMGVLGEHKAAQSAEGATRDLGYEADILGDKATDAARGVNRVGDAAAEARPRIKGLGGAAQKAADDFADLRRDAKKAGEAVADAAYGPEHLRLEFEKNRAELKNNQTELGKTADKIKELERKGKPVPKHLRDEFLDLKLGVNESKQSVIDTGIQLHSMGKISLAQLEAAFGRQNIRLDDLTGAAREYWIWLHRVAALGPTLGFNGGHGSTSNTHGHATGGHEGAGSWSTVGEKGIELVHTLPGGGMDVFPMGTGPFAAASSATAAAPSAQSQTIVVPIYLDGRQIAQVTAPHVTKWQQDHRLLGTR